MNWEDISFKVSERHNQPHWCSHCLWQPGILLTLTSYRIPATEDFSFTGASPIKHEFWLTINIFLKTHWSVCFCGWWSKYFFRRKVVWYFFFSLCELSKNQFWLKIKNSHQKMEKKSFDSCLNEKLSLEIENHLQKSKPQNWQKIYKSNQQNKQTKKIRTKDTPRKN